VCHLGVDALDGEKDSTCPDSECLYFGSAQNSLRRLDPLSPSFSGSWGIFSNSSGSAFDEERVLARNGTRVLSSLSHLVAVLGKSGIDGPRHLQAINLGACGEVIGYGSQFTVFRDSPTSTGIMGTGYSRLGGLVAKRVKITAIQDNGQDLVSGENYRRHLMSLELEILALCHPRIRLHRNVADIVAWGYDYPTLQTPIPVLFMEAASSTLAQFLKNERKWEIKQHLALDIAAGLEVLHQHNIVHGDMKPANVLVFEQTHTKIPFVAKISDFGVCIDLLNSPSLLTVYDYIGTPDWKAPELSWPHELETSVSGGFCSRMMLHFDAYSYGLVVVSIFCKNGEAPQLGVTRHSKNSHAQAAADLIRDREELPPVLKSKLSSALKSLLASEPLSRTLPNPKSLMTDCPSCRDW
jgi:serine/threonine protein kinase